ncbi:hypothetical protein M9H77_12984 [Catharanthus roseus]|uniref:Uncharacterized protein n=1 Tax=Catharanthus roseus TaxID=4058 RepID=A0ACC0BIV3_CATRO|nr:hypothetical protein M9H77_12984 [Catharanthus roseus]
MAKRKEEEHKGMAVIFEKILQNITWHVQVEESKEASLEGFVAPKSKEKEFLGPTTGWVHPTFQGRDLPVEEKSSLNLPPTRIMYKFPEDTKNQFACFEGQPERAKTEPTSDVLSLKILNRGSSSKEVILGRIMALGLSWEEVEGYHRGLRVECLEKARGYKP